MANANKGTNPLHFGSDLADAETDPDQCGNHDWIPHHVWLQQPKFKVLGGLGTGGQLCCQNAVS